VRKQQKEEAEAATRLQSIARGRLARAQQAREGEAAVVLQRAARERAQRIESDRAEREIDRAERALQQSVKPLINWSVAEVISWLEHSVGLPQYVELFERHEVDGALLSYLDKVALEELGVPSALHRLKLLTSLAQLPAVQQCLADMSAASDAPAVPSGATTAEVRRSALGLMDRSGSSARDAMTEQSRRETLEGQVYPQGVAAGQWPSPWGTP